MCNIFIIITVYVMMMYMSGKELADMTAFSVGQLLHLFLLALRPIRCSRLKPVQLGSNQPRMLPQGVMLVLLHLLSGPCVLLSDNRGKKEREKKTL